MKKEQRPIDIAPPGKPAREYRVYPALIERCAELEPVTTAVAHPCDESSLKAAVEAADGELIRPILVGPQARIRAVAEQCGVDIAAFRLVDTPHSYASAAKAVEIVRAGDAETLMKGSLHTDELMAEVVRKDGGLRTERRISHVFIMDVPTYAKPLAVTDAAINIFPDLETKVDIVQNAIEMAHGLGRELPKVAILSAVETVTPKIPSTIDAAALCKMAERGQITGALLDGPLAFDNAISKEAAAIKGIRSEVAGDVDILVVPDLEAGNMLAKQLSFLANADAAGIVLGARVPIILTSRADTVRARTASCAVAVLSPMPAGRRRPRLGRRSSGDDRSRPDHQCRLVQRQVLGLPDCRTRPAGAVGQRPGRGYRHRAAPGCRGRRGQSAGRPPVSERPDLRPRRVLSRGRRLAARAFRRPGIAARGRPPRRAWRHRIRGAGARQSRGPRQA
jgi:phosphate acetyltransferase